MNCSPARILCGRALIVYVNDRRLFNRFSLTIAASGADTRGARGADTRGDATRRFRYCHCLPARDGRGARLRAAQWPLLRGRREFLPTAAPISRMIVYPWLLSPVVNATTLKTIRHSVEMLSPSLPALGGKQKFKLKYYQDVLLE
jgi:hypothetical protein